MAKEFQNYAEKEAYVQEVFSSIAKHYDLMNTLLSFNQDSKWRRFAVNQLNLSEGMQIVDVACGTGMLTRVALEQVKDLQVCGLDFSPEMLGEGERRLGRLGLLDRVNLIEGDAMALPYGDNQFDGAMSAFALRNVPSIEEALSEMKRVVKPGGRVVTLELAKPSMMGFKQLYYVYFNYILPILGKMSRDNSSYAWLPESLKAYPHQKDVLAIFEKVGFESTTYYELTGGIVAVHVGVVGE